MFLVLAQHPWITSCPIIGAQPLYVVINCRGQKDVLLRAKVEFPKKMSQREELTQGSCATICPSAEESSVHQEFLRSYSVILLYPRHIFGVVSTYPHFKLMFSSCSTAGRNLGAAGPAGEQKDGHNRQPHRLPGPPPLH